MVVGCVLFFLCVLIIPARRRKKFRDMVKTDRYVVEYGITRLFDYYFE